MKNSILLYRPKTTPLHFDVATVTAVVLAAGASTRMGTPKLLLSLDGEPLLRRTVRHVSAAGFDAVLVVLGHEHAKMLEALDGLPVHHVVNAEYESGMGSSFRTAIEHLDATADAALFALADQPFVTAAEYRSVLDAYHRHPGGIVCARYGEITAPPHLFDKAFFGELAQLQHGARPVLRRHPDRTTVVQFPPDLLLDVDTREDYERARSRLSSRAPASSDSTER